jgi:hypothetical protein
MKEYTNGEIVNVKSGNQSFKVKIGTGTASIQLQANNEGFDEVTDGNFTATGFGVINPSNCQIKAVLTGDARFFMSAQNNRF